jgi:hypothetical protein
MYVTIYCYFDPEFRVSAEWITHFLYLEYQECAFLNCTYQKGPCEHIPRSFFRQLGHLKWRHIKFFHFFIFLNYICLIEGPLPAKSAGACAKFRNTRRFVHRNDSWYAYLMWSIIYLGCCAQLLKCYFDSCLTKKIRFWYSKNRKRTFHRKRPPWHSSLSQGPRVCSI